MVKGKKPIIAKFVLDSGQIYALQISSINFSNFIYCLNEITKINR
jgi:hypothetical protein